MDLKFVPPYQGGANKRRRLQQACAMCKRRKKRCFHNHDEEISTLNDTAYLPTAVESHNKSDHRNDTFRISEDHGTTSMGECPTPFDSSLGNNDGRLKPDGALTDTRHETNSGHSAYSSMVKNPRSLNSSHSVPHRFVGDLNPEVTFLEKDVATPTSCQSSKRDDIGVWVNKDEWDILIRRKEAIGDADPIQHVDCSLAQKDSNLLLKDARMLKSDQEAMIEIYFSQINSIIPIVDEEAFRPSYEAQRTSDVLVNGMCLVAAKDKEAERHLRLCSATPILMHCRDFSNRLHRSIDEALKCQSFDKVTLIRIHTLMSLHSEGIDGAEEASLHLMQAIHHAQTIGLHLGKGNEDDSLKKLFWSLWSLDKVNAAMNGRPVQIADRDLGITIYSSTRPEDVAFVVWLRISTMLSSVIDLYRPTTAASVTGWEDDFPGFEEILDEHRDIHLTDKTLATLHMFYLIVAMLSSRSRSIKQIPSSTFSYVRQSLSAQYAISMMNGDTNVHPLPIISYGVSLALSVSYKQMRQSSLPHQKRKAKLDFRSCYAVLQILRQKWWSADIMAVLAEKVLDDVDKIPIVTDSRVRINHRTLPSHENSRSTSLMAPPDHHRVRKTGPARDAQEPDQCVNRQHEEEPPMIDPEADVQLVPNHGGDATTLETNFEGIDNIFDAYMDPYFPVNFDDILNMEI